MCTTNKFSLTIFLWQVLFVNVYAKNWSFFLDNFFLATSSGFYLFEIFPWWSYRYTRASFLVQKLTWPALPVTRKLVKKLSNFGGTHKKIKLDKEKLEIEIETIREQPTYIYVLWKNTQCFFRTNVTGQNDRRSKNVTGQKAFLAGHWPLTGRYFEPCSKQIQCQKQVEL